MRVAIVVMGLAILPLSGPAADPAPLTFRFQNNFWVNLHHVVRGDARRTGLRLPLTVALESLQPAERAAWSEALTAYADLAMRNLVYDARLVAINNALAGVTTDVLPPGVIETRLRQALNGAAPVYRAHGWDEQQRRNDAWIADMRPQAERYTAAVAPALAAVYHATWPAAPIVVDACAEAGPDNAYTTDGPPGSGGHTVIAVRPTSNSGDTGVEIIFHEASHTIDTQIARPLVDEARRQRVGFADGLEHVLLFYTTGEILRREFARAGKADYVPYGDRFGVYHNEWRTFRAAIERDWGPYLDGKTTFDAAIAALVRDAHR